MFRKKLKDIAAALLGSFVSRNNDVDGYWALGQLRAPADAAGLTEVRLDLFPADAEPSGTLISRVTQVYSGMLERQLRRHRLHPNRILRAAMVLSFIEDDTNMGRFASYGEPFKCTVSLFDDNGRKYERTLVARCAVHDPRRERRSVRLG